MKIYYICSSDISTFNAQRTHILEVVSEMHESGVNVTLFLPRFHKEREDFPFKTIYIPIFFKNLKIKFAEYEIWLLFRLLWKLLFKRPDIVYIRKGYLSIIPVALSRVLFINSIIEVNGIIAEEVKIAFGLPDLAIRFFALIEILTYRWANKVVVVTEGLKYYLTNNYHIDENKIEIIHNGVNIHKFVPKSISPSNKINLGFVGNLVEWAGVETLIRSIPFVIKKNPDVIYTIVGRGLLKESLEHLASSLKVEKYLEFKGEVEPDLVPDYINLFDICLLPATKERNSVIGISPLKLYEYLACGKPVIVTNVKGLEFVQQYEIGLIAESDNPKSFADITLKLMADKKKREEMGMKARQIAVEQFSWSRTTHTIINLCQHLNSKM